MVQAFQRLHLQLDSAGQWIAISKTLRRQQLVRAIGYILFPFLVGIVIVRNSSKVINELKTRSATLAKELVGDVVSDKAELQSFADNLKQYPTYLIWSTKEGILKQLDDYSRTVNELQRSRSLPREMQLAESIKLVSKIQSQIQSYNEEFVKRRKREYAPLFTKASVHLDDSQLDAIITDDQHNCVIACAGSGKTEVLINRIAYLVCRNPDTIDPNRVLALAFQRNAAREIEARLRERFSVSVKVKTFHALGLEILRTAGTPAELKFDSDAGYSEFIDGLFRKREREPEFLNLLISYMKNFDSSPPRPESDFETREEFYRFMRNQSYVALNGVQVKSEAEKAILNFFLSHRLNGREVDIRYEAKASWMQYRNNKNQIITPRPDFYLPDFDVYIEHWAVDAAGNAPRWFADASQYKLTMEKKRAAYKTHRKTLIETTAADFNKEDFEETLQGRTAAALNSQFPMVRFAFTPVPYEELVEKAYYEQLSSCVRAQSSFRECPSRAFVPYSEFPTFCA
jgi:DNA helicase-4